MTVAGDASAIIALSAVNRLELIRQLYQVLYIPEAVYNEVASVEASKPGVRELLSAPWIITRAVTRTSLVGVLQAELDEGEAEAIALAGEISADILLMDERRGRSVAHRQGLQVVGVLGVLIEAKHKGLIPAVKPLLQELIATAGFYISRPLYQSVLQAVGETL